MKYLDIAICALFLGFGIGIFFNPNEPSHIGASLGWINAAYYYYQYTKNSY